MSSLFQHEVYGSGKSAPFSLDLKALKARERRNAPADITAIYERIWNGSMTGLVSGKFSDRDVFYSSCLQTCIDRDVKEHVQPADPLLFSDLVLAAACRAGQMLNVHDIAQDVGISDDTAKRWLQELEQSDVIFFLRPFSNSLLKRTVKIPKLYFLDTGLVAHLTRYCPRFWQTGRSTAPSRRTSWSPDCKRLTTITPGNVCCGTTATATPMRSIW